MSFFLRDVNGGYADIDLPRQQTSSREVQNKLSKKEIKNSALLRHGDLHHGGSHATTKRVATKQQRRETSSNSLQDDVGDVNNKKKSSRIIHGEEDAPSTISIATGDGFRRRFSEPPTVINAEKGVNSTCSSYLKMPQHLRSQLLHAAAAPMSFTDAPAVVVLGRHSMLQPLHWRIPHPSVSRFHVYFEAQVVPPTCEVSPTRVNSRQGKNEEKDQPLLSLLGEEVVIVMHTIGNNPVFLNGKCINNSSSTASITTTSSRHYKDITSSTSIGDDDGGAVVVLHEGDVLSLLENPFDPISGVLCEAPSNQDQPKQKKSRNVTEEELATSFKKQNKKIVGAPLFYGLRCCGNDH